MKPSVFIALIALAAPTVADELATVGRDLVTKNVGAVVTVHLVVETNMSMFGQDRKQESKSEVQGTVIDPDGLTVIGLMAVEQDLTSRLQAMMGGGGDEDTAEIRKQLGIKNTIKSVKISYKEGAETPATIALRDKNVGLAFLRPAEKLAQPAAAISLASDATAGMLDEVFVLSRMGVQGGYGPRIGIERIASVIEKPRLSYAFGSMGNPGIPAFLRDGRLLGIVGMRKAPKTDTNLGGGFGLLSSFNENAVMDLIGMPCIVPAAEIAESAKQATGEKAEK
jgi:hypothetical protein